MQTYTHQGKVGIQYTVGVGYWAAAHILSVLPENHDRTKKTKSYLYVISSDKTAQTNAKLRQLFDPFKVHFKSLMSFLAFFLLSCILASHRRIDSAAHKQQPEYLSHVDGRWMQSIDSDESKLLQFIFKILFYFSLEKIYYFQQNEVILYDLLWDLFCQSAWVWW